MSRAIREHLRHVIAITVLIALALASSYVIVQHQRLRIPILEKPPFELRAELQTAQAVQPGQGQTVRVAGVAVGEVEDVTLQDGVAVVTFGIDRDYLPIYRDATVLMRPQTGLKDMFFELDPGTRSAGAYADGDTIPASHTAPDVNLDEVLSVLDTDTRAYLRILAVGLGGGLQGRDADLARELGTLGPINHDLAGLNRALAARDSELARLVHNLSVLSAAVGRRNADLSELVSSANGALGALAGQAPDLRRLVARLPGTLATGRRALRHATPFARELGPTLQSLRPVAGQLDEVAAAVQGLAHRATPAIRDRLRPLARAARPAIPDLRVSAERYAAAAPRLTVIARKVNALGNMTAFNPGGAEPPGSRRRDEGFLFWLGWFAHNGNSVFTGQDAHGDYRRLYFTASCANLQNFLRVGPGGPVLGGLLTGLGPLFAAGGECNAR